MQISPRSASSWRARRNAGRTRTLEIGTFTGYSALWVASALPRGGRLVACDVSKEYTDIARRYWRRAKVASKIDLRLGPALATLDGLLEDGKASGFDSLSSTPTRRITTLLRAALRLLRPGGVIAFDNVLWGGGAADPSRKSETKALRRIARKIHKVPRVTASLLPLGDGLLLARKRGRVPAAAAARHRSGGAAPR